MQRRAFLLGLGTAVAAGLPAHADPASQVVGELAQQGYQDIKVYTTWLGRVRILADRDGGVREIVLNPRTGEILRDLWTASNGSERTVSIIDDVSSGGGSSGGQSKSTPGTRPGKTSSGGTTSGGTSNGSSTGSGGSNGSGGGTSGGGSTGGTSGGGTSGGGTSGGGGSTGSDSKSESSDNEQGDGKLRRSVDR